MRNAMSRFVIFLFVYLFFAFSGQASTTDDLKEQLDSLQSAQEKLQLLDHYRSQFNDEAPLDKAHYQFMRGMVYERLNNLEAALSAFDQAILLAESVPTSALLVDALLERSYIKYLQTNDGQTFCPDRYLALEYARQIDDSTMLVNALIKNAFCYAFDVSTFAKGLNLLEEALEVSKHKALPANTNAMIYNASGLLYGRNQMYDKAYEFLHKAYEQWALVEDYQDMFNMQHSLNDMAIYRQRLDLAEQHVAKLFELTESQPGFKDFRFFALYNAGLLANAQSDYPQAIEYYQQALARQQDTQEMYFVRRVYDNLIVAMFRAGHTAQTSAIIQERMQRFPNEANTKLTEAMTALYSGQHQQALEHMFEQLDLERENNRAFVQQATAATAVVYDDSITQLDNKILQQTIEIKDLQLSKEQAENRVAYLSLSLVSIVVIVLLLFVRHLLSTRRDFIHRSQTDYLTGIANRRYTFEQGQDLLYKAQKQSQPFSLLIFDIDKFKQINDSLGHELGDEAIKKVVHQCKQTLRKQELVGRIGGEEFLTLLPQTDHQQALDIAERVRKSVASASVSNDSQSFSLTISLGVASADAQDSFKSMLKRADDALYLAKNQGRNQVVSAQD